MGFQWLAVLQRRLIDLGAPPALAAPRVLLSVLVCAFLSWVWARPRQPLRNRARDDDVAAAATNRRAGGATSGERAGEPVSDAERSAFEAVAESVRGGAVKLGSPSQAQQLQVRPPRAALPPLQSDQLAAVAVPTCAACV